MVTRQNEQIARRLGNHSRLNRRTVHNHLTHHGAAEDNSVIADLRVCRRDAFGDLGADRHMQHNRLPHLAGHRQILGRNALALGQSGIDVQQGANIINHCTNVKRQAALRHGLTGNELHHGLFIARRIEGRHGEKLDVCASLVDRSLKGLDLSFVLCLQRDNGLLGTQMSRNRCCSNDDTIREGTAQVLIGLNQRLTFSRIDDKPFGFCVELHVGRKTRAARADDTRGLDRFDQIHNAFTTLLQQAGIKLHIVNDTNDRCINRSTHIASSAARRAAADDDDSLTHASSNDISRYDRHFVTAVIEDVQRLNKQQLQSAQLLFFSRRPDIADHFCNSHNSSTCFGWDRFGPLAQAAAFRYPLQAIHRDLPRIHAPDRSGSPSC